MNARAAALLEAARVPKAVQSGDFGPWQIRRLSQQYFPNELLVGWPTYTVLARHTMATLHLEMGEVVMEDSRRELSRHLPIMLHAKGRVLVSGLGLGCVVRGLLANPEVSHITVVEIDGHIIRAVWHEFMPATKCLLLQGDAFEMNWPPGTRFDYAWHDIWHEETHEALLHGKLMVRYMDLCSMQGARGMPRWWRRRVGGDFVQRTVMQSMVTAPNSHVQCDESFDVQ